MEPVVITCTDTEADDRAAHAAGTCKWDCWLCEDEANAKDPMNFQ